MQLAPTDRHLLTSFWPASPRMRPRSERSGTKWVPPAEMDRGYYLSTRDVGVEADTIAVDPWRLRFECQAKRQIVARNLDAERMARQLPEPAHHIIQGYLSALTSVSMELAI